MTTVHAVHVYNAGIGLKFVEARVLPEPTNNTEHFDLLDLSQQSCELIEIDKRLYVDTGRIGPRSWDLWKATSETWTYPSSKSNICYVIEQCVRKQISTLFQTRCHSQEKSQTQNSDPKPLLA